MKRSRKYRVTLSDLLIFLTAVPVSIGVVAAVALTASNQSLKWFGNAWTVDVMHFLIDSVGVPRSFVYGYVVFAVEKAPAWVCYIVIAFALGLLRSKWAFTFGVAFVTSIFVWDLTSDYFFWLGPLLGFHYFIKLRLFSLFGVSVAALCFAAGRKLRGGAHVPERRTGRIAIGLTCAAIAASLAVSMYGWRLVDLNRKEGRQFQEGWKAGLEAIDSLNNGQSQ